MEYSTEDEDIDDIYIQLEDTEEDSDNQSSSRCGQ